MFQIECFKIKTKKLLVELSWPFCAFCFCPFFHLLWVCCRFVLLWICVSYSILKEFLALFSYELLSNSIQNPRKKRRDTFTFCAYSPLLIHGPNRSTCLSCMQYHKLYRGDIMNRCRWMQYWIHIRQSNFVSSLWWLIGRGWWNQG